MQAWHPTTSWVFGNVCVSMLDRKDTSGGLCLTHDCLQVRIDRGPDLQSISTAGLYPCGEGAGYAGGIVSAAVDGLRVAQAILQDDGVSA